MDSLEDDLECDVVIVGAGLTGLTVANEITSRNTGLTVLVLESFGNFSIIKSIQQKYV